MNKEHQKLSRKERERLFKRQEIVNAARVVFAARGFNAATLDEIAERAEFGKGTIYNYFQSKDELFETVLADIFDEFVEIAVTTCSSPERSLQESFQALARQVMRHLFGNIGMYNLLMREMHRMDQNTHLAAMFPNLILIVQEPLKRATASGEIEPLPEAQVGFIFMTTIFSLFKSTIYMNSDHVCVDGVVRLTLNEEEIDVIIERNLSIIDRTFFNGVLRKKTTIQGKAV